MSRKQSAARSHHSAFTLIELSIVLVIIGLIVGGVLVGQNLIAAAAARATIAQKDRFDAAVNTFRGKYDCMPADCANGARFGLYNGYGKGTLPASLQDDAYKWFFRDLANVHLIGDAFPGLTNCEMDAGNVCSSGPGGIGNGMVAGFNSPACPVCAQIQVTQQSYTVSSGGWLIFDFGTYPDALNSFALAGPGGVGPLVSPTWGWMLTPGSGVNVAGPTYITLTAPAAYAIDSKIDDGKPLTGNFVAVGWAFTGPNSLWSPSIPFPDNTWVNSASNQYITTNNTVGMNAVWKAGF